MKELELLGPEPYRLEWAPLYAGEEVLREAFKEELVSLYGFEEASIRFVLDPLKIALYEYEHELIPIDIDPHED